MANIAQCKYDPNVKAVRLNMKITEVKQPQDQSKMGDHYILSFSAAEILGKLGKFSKLISLNFGKTQLAIKVIKITLILDKV